MRHEIAGQFFALRYQYFSFFQSHRLVNLVLFYFISQCLLQTFTLFWPFLWIPKFKFLRDQFIAASISTNKNFKKKVLVFRFNEVLQYPRNLCKHKNKKFCTKIIISNEPLLNKSCFTLKLLGRNSSFSVFCHKSRLFLHFIVYFYFQSIFHMLHHFLRRS